MEDYNFLIERILFQALGIEPAVQSVDMQTGGCINMSVKATTDQGGFFVKWNELDFEDMFEKEARGLEELRTANTIRVPQVLAVGNIEEKAFMVQEFLEKTPLEASSSKQLGEQLAQMHRLAHEFHGFHEPNYIGKLQQKNESSESWVDFFISNRLNVQLGLAIYNKEVDEPFVGDMKSFLNKLPEIMPDSKASLLHGDLWNGNVMNTQNGPAIFDPAVYYGAREMDIAMTRLFGGFDNVFYDAYQANYPLGNHFEDLIDIYNLYPLMVHVNIFGANSGYLGMVKRVIKRYL